MDLGLCALLNRALSICMLLSSTQQRENIYDQKPVEPTPEPVAPAVMPSAVQSAPRTSRFVYTDDQPSSNTNNSASGHVMAPSTAGDFFMEFGGSGGSRRQSSGSRPKAQVLLLSN